MVIVEIEGVYIAGMNGGWVRGVELPKEIWGVNVLPWFP
jgi:hypothetical protein